MIDMEDNEHFKQFMSLYDKLRGKVESVWVFGLIENVFVCYPKFDNQPKEFKPLFELTAKDINTGLESKKWDVVLSTFENLKE